MIEKIKKNIIYNKMYVLYIITSILLILGTITMFLNIDYYQQKNINVWLLGDSLFDHSEFNDVGQYNIENLLSLAVKKIPNITYKNKGKANAGLIASKWFDNDIVSNKNINQNDIIFISIGGNDIIDYVKNDINIEENMKYIIENVSRIIDYYKQSVIDSSKQIIYVIPYKYFMTNDMYFKLIDIFKKLCKQWNIDYISLEDFKIYIDYKVDKNSESDVPHYTKRGVNKLLSKILGKLF